MKERNKAIDMAKGISLLTLPAIHSTLFYSTKEVYSSPLGMILAFVAENLGAPLFLMTMGWSIIYSSKKSITQILSRSVRLIVLGYLLNYLKFILPGYWNGIPVELFIENNIPNDFGGVVRLLLIGDILQLAGISYFLCSIIYRIKWRLYFTLFSFCVIVFIGPSIWNITIESQSLRTLINLLTGVPPDSFFPFFPWGACPLMGLLIGHLSMSLVNKDFRKLLLIGGIVICGCGFVLRFLEPKDWEFNFYRLGPGGTLLHLGGAIFAIWLCDTILKYTKREYMLTNLLTILSKNVTVVYMIQWIVVCWAMFMFGYHTLKLGDTLVAISFNTVLTIVLSLLFTKIITKWKQLSI